MKVVRFDRLLASTALGIVIVLSGQAANAQQLQGQQDQQIQIVAPEPNDATAQKDSDATTAQDSKQSDAGTETPESADAAKAAMSPEPQKAATAPVMTEPKVAEPEKTVEAPAATEPEKAAEAPTTAEPKMAEPVTAEPKMAAPEKTVEAPTAAPVSPTANSVVAEKLRELVTGKALDRAVDRKAERAGVEAFYKARDYAPIWVNDGAEAARAKSAIAYLGKADEVGLDPRDYPTPDFASAITASALAEAELKLTATALSFARHAEIGRIHFTRVAADISFKLNAPEPADVLAKLAATDDAGKALDSYNPPQAGFKALREKLADLRAGKAEAAKLEEEKPAPIVRIAGGPIMRLGTKDARVIALRKRLKIEGNAESRLYDEAVVESVMAFQTEADLSVDGNVGPNTLAALNGEKREAHRPPADPIDTIVVNMERWRWLPRDLGNPHVIVNVPDYRLTLYNNDKLYWTTKIVVGKPNKATPMISSEMKFITVNPTWNVPPSIIENEYLPALEQDPDALERIGLKLEQAADGTVRIYQPPGARNALGRIRFNFPNKFLVYQHDTPDKYLFKKSKRAYSHGCMRVENPLTYGEKLLSLALPEKHYTAAKLESMFGGSEININFPKNIWVHLTYQTAFVDEDGKLQFREDVYGRDRRMISILKGSERKVADLAIARPPNHSSRPVRAPIGMYGGGGGNYDSGPNFFELLFGGGRSREVERPYRRSRSVGPRYGNDGRIVTR